MQVGGEAWPVRPATRATRWEYHSLRVHEECAPCPWGGSMARHAWAPCGYGNGPAMQKKAPGSRNAGCKHKEIK